MDDGKMRVDITDVVPGKEIQGVVANPHFLKSNKGCNVPGVILSMPFISPRMKRTSASVLRTMLTTLPHPSCAAGKMYWRSGRF